MYKNKKEMIYFSIHIIFFVLTEMIFFEFLSEIINKFFSLESRAPFVMDFENFVFSIINAPIAEEVIFRKWTSDFLKKRTIIMFILHTAGFIWSLKKIGKGFYKLF